MADVASAAAPEGSVFLFAKYPTPGTVKTRLQPAIGAQGAGVVARAFILDICHRFARWNAARRAVADATVPRLSLVVLAAPAPAVPQFEALLASEGLSDHWSVEAQLGGLAVNLEAKLMAALEGVSDSQLALFLGMDTPDLPEASVQAAAQAAARGRAYIRLAEDGGWVLLAVPRGCTSNVFTGIAWSQPCTGEDQIRRLRECGLEVTIDAETSRDVDEVEDLRALGARLAAPEQTAACPRSSTVVHSLLEGIESAREG